MAKIRTFSLAGPTREIPSGKMGHLVCSGSQSERRIRLILPARGFSHVIGTLRSNDADDNENVKKTIGLISKTTTSHVQHTFLFISFPFLHDYDVKIPNFAFYGGRK